MDQVELYLEAHITIAPVFGLDRKRVNLIAAPFGFKLAKLLMQKEREATPVQSDLDTFMTGHSKSCQDIENRTKALVQALNENGFKVWRYKIENTILDSRSKDIWSLLDASAPTKLPISMCDQCVRIVAITYSV